MATNTTDSNNPELNIDDDTMQNVNDDEEVEPEIDSVADDDDDDDDDDIEDVGIGDDDEEDDIEDDDDEIGDVDEDGVIRDSQPQPQKITGNIGGPSSGIQFPISQGVQIDEDDKISEGLDEIEYDEEALKKINNERDSMNIVHPEQETVSLEELSILTTVTRNKNGIIIDALHKTLPRLTKYEKTRIIGSRIKQLNSGAPPYIVTDGKVIDKAIIAERELQEKKIPFIIKRPLPNGGSEYWKLDDLEVY